MGMLQQCSTPCRTGCRVWGAKECDKVPPKSWHLYKNDVVTHFLHHRNSAVAICGTLLSHHHMCCTAAGSVSDVPQYRTMPLVEQCQRQ